MRRVARVLAWPAWAVGQVLVLVSAGDLIDTTPGRTKLDRSQKSAWRARLAHGVLEGAQRDRQPDYFASADRLTRNLLLPDGLLEIDEDRLRWSPLAEGRLRELGESWSDVRSIHAHPLDRSRYALTLDLEDGSRVGLVTDDDPADLPVVAELLETSG